MQLRITESEKLSGQNFVRGEKRNYGFENMKNEWKYNKNKSIGLEKGLNGKKLGVDVNK